MVLAIRNDCPGCRRFSLTGDFFHEREEWEQYHKAGWIGGKSDWQPREELVEFLANMKQAWELTQIPINGNTLVYKGRIVVKKMGPI